jgi:RNA polymerase sigma-70 factor (ECF subfamily)
MVHVHDMLAALSPDERELLHIVFVLGMSYHDASVVLGIPVGTAKSRIFRIRHQLQGKEASSE